MHPVPPCKNLPFPAKYAQVPISHLWLTLMRNLSSPEALGTGDPPYQQVPSTWPEGITGPPSHIWRCSAAQSGHTPPLEGRGSPQISPLCRIWYLWGPWHGSPKDTKGDTSWNLLCNTAHILHLFKATSLSLPTHHWNTRERTPPCHVSLKTKMKEKSRGGNPAKHVISSSIHGAALQGRQTPSLAQPSKGRNLARTKQRREVFAGAVAVRAFSAPQIFSVEGKTFRMAATSNCKTKGAEKGSRESTPGFVESRRSVTASPKAQPQSLAATDVL